MTDAELEVLELSTTQLAELFRCTPRRIRQLEAEGLAVKAGRGRWALAATVRALVPSLRDSAAGRAEGSLTEARARLTKARARQAEIDAALQEGQVVSIPAIEQSLSDVYLHFRNRLRALPYSLANKLALETKKRKMVATEIDAALNELARFDPAKAREQKRRR